MLRAERGDGAEPAGHAFPCGFVLRITGRRKQRERPASHARSASRMNVRPRLAILLCDPAYFFQSITRCFSICAKAPTACRSIRPCRSHIFKSTRAWSSLQFPRTDAQRGQHKAQNNIP